MGLHCGLLAAAPAGGGGTFEAAAFEHFWSVRVKELNDKQQRQIFGRRLPSQVHVVKFGVQLEFNPTLGQMAKNPLLLGVTLAV